MREGASEKKDCSDGERTKGQERVRRKWDSLAFSLPFCKALLLAGVWAGWQGGTGEFL